MKKILPKCQCWNEKVKANSSYDIAHDDANCTVVYNNANYTNVNNANADENYNDNHLLS